jgi:hypothetical protein
MEKIKTHAKEFGADDIGFAGNVFLTVNLWSPW